MNKNQVYKKKIKGLSHHNLFLRPGFAGAQGALPGGGEGMKERTLRVRLGFEVLADAVPIDGYCDAGHWLTIDVDHLALDGARLGKGRNCHHHCYKKQKQDFAVESHGNPPSGNIKLSKFVHTPVWLSKQWDR